MSDYLSRVAAHIPTEILALYTMALALLVKDDPVPGRDGKPITPALPVAWFWVFLVATPVFVWLINAVHSRAVQRNYLPWSSWPWWKMISASLAFTVWSAALPKSAFSHESWYSPGACTVALIFAAVVLPLLDAVIGS